MGMTDMKNKRFYRLIRTAAVLLLALLLVLTSAGYARAEGVLVIDPDREDCSITLSLHYKDNGKSRELTGGEISLYTVASVKEDNGYFFDVSTSRFADVKEAAAIPSMSSKELSKNNFSIAKTLESTAGKVQADRTEKIEGGEVSFTGLKPGLYLIVQTVLSDGDRKVNSFLISIPDEEGNFQISGEPKPGIYTPSEKETETEKPDRKTPSRKKLPQTGQLWWPVPVMGSAGILLIGAGIWSKKKEDYAG